MPVSVTVPVSVTTPVSVPVSVTGGRRGGVAGETAGAASEELDIIDEEVCMEKELGPQLQLTMLDYNKPYTLKLNSLTSLYLLS